MSLAERTIQTYLTTMTSVPGWFYPLDFLAFVEINRIQAEAGYVGDVLEIGTYCGRSAVLLGYLLRPGERLYVCDTFGNSEGLTASNQAENENHYGRFSQDDFERHYRRFHGTLPTILSMPSRQIDSARLADDCRVVHIDGSHAYEMARQDIDLSERILGPGGIVALDDVCRTYLPGPALAIWETVLSGRLVPICLTRSKLYGTWDDAAGWLTDAMIEWAGHDPRLGFEVHQLAGWKVPRIFATQTLSGLAA
jgi:hypothetical protein